MPTILVPTPQRMTPPWYPYPMMWKPWFHGDKWEEDGYKLMLLCRGARIPARQVHCEGNSYTWDKWMKSYGSLWLLSEGVYEIRKEEKDLELHIDVIKTGNFNSFTIKAPTITPPYTNMWGQPQYAQPTAELTGALWDSDGNWIGDDS